MSAHPQRNDDELLTDAVEDAPADEIDRASLAIAVDALAPTFAVMAPIFVLVALLMSDGIERWRLGAWLAGCAAASTIAVIALVRYRRRGVAAKPWLYATMTAVGLVYGAAALVPPSNDIDTVLAFCLLPIGASGMYAIATGPRRDLFGFYQFSSLATSAAGLLRTRDPRLSCLAACGAAIAVVTVSMHRRVHHAALDAIHSKWRTRALMAQLRSEGSALSAANDRLASTNAQLTFQALHDPLTNLLNRRGAIEAIDEALARATPEHPLGLLYIDLDRFKQINDSLGHRGGDQFLSALSGRLARALENGALAGRIGGDEFVAMLPGADMSFSMSVARRLIGVLGQPVHAEGREVPSSVSIGVASGPMHGDTSTELMRNANAALHRAKAQGRNRIEPFTAELREEIIGQLDAEQALRRAIDDDRIVPFFQPEVDATTGHVVGAELLARWLHPDGSLVAAADFITTAGQAGLLERLTERVMAQARPHIRRLTAFGLPAGFRFRVNVPPRATKRSWNENPVETLISGIDPRLITIDVTEALVTDDLAAAAANLAAFRARGGRVCLDEFARGVSSLSLLRKLPLDEVRIDRSSIDALTTHPHDRAIVRSIIALVRELNLTVTADGVETGAQADALIALGCIRHQGHLYRAAQPAESLESFLAERQAERLLPTDDPSWRFTALTE